MAKIVVPLHGGGLMRVLSKDAREITLETYDGSKRVTIPRSDFFLTEINDDDPRWMNRPKLDQAEINSD